MNVCIVQRLVLRGAVALLAAVVATTAMAACDAPTTVSFTPLCADENAGPPGVYSFTAPVTVRIQTGPPLTSGMWVSGTTVSIFNDGGFNLTGPTVTALSLLGDDLSYVGSATGTMQAPDAGVVVNAGTSASLTIDHDITTTGQGVSLQTAGTATIEIGRGATITGFTPIRIEDGDGSTRIILAGNLVALDAANEAILFLNDDNVLELRDGYRMTGFVGGGLGETGLVLGGAEDSSFDTGDINDATGRFRGFDSFSKIGTGTWTLSGTATQAFQLSVEGGGLRLATDLLPSSGIHVEAGAGFGGNGYAGDLDFDAGSFFDVRVGANSSDHVTAGVATLAGAVVRVTPGAGSYAASSIYTILLADERIGEFAGVELTIDVPLLSPSLSYVGDTVELHLDRNGTSFASLARSAVQKSVAERFDALGTNAPNYAALLTMSEDEARAAMDQMSGAGFAASGGALIQSGETIGTAVIGRAQQQASALGALPLLGYSAFSTEHWQDGLEPSVWGRVLAGTSSGGGASSGSAGLVAGADIQLGDDWMMGALLGVGSSAIAAGNTDARSADFLAGLYGAKEWDLATIRFGGSLTAHLLSTRRTVAAPGIDEVLTASYGAMTAQVFGEVSHGFALGPVSGELFAAASYSRHFAPGFTEVGGPSALTVSPAMSDAVSSTIGMRVEHKVPLQAVLLTWRGTLGWKHTETTLAATANSFTGSAPFQVPGGVLKGDALIARAEASFDLDERSGLDVNYDIELSTRGFAQSIGARYAMTF